MAGQQPGTVAASGQHLPAQPGRLVAAAQRGAAAGCRLVRGGARHGRAVPPTVAVVVLCTAAYLLCVDRRRCAAFVPAMQFVGAYSYSLMGWSDLWRDYDRPEQASLWRWDRPQIGYHLANLSSERARKPPNTRLTVQPIRATSKQVMATYLNYPGPIPVNVPNRNRNTAP